MIELTVQYLISFTINYLMGDSEWTAAYFENTVMTASGLRVLEKIVTDGHGEGRYNTIKAILAPFVIHGIASNGASHAGATPRAFYAP